MHGLLKYKVHVKCFLITLRAFKNHGAMYIQILFIYNHLMLVHKLYHVTFVDITIMHSCTYYHVTFVDITIIYSCTFLPSYIGVHFYHHTFVYIFTIMQIYITIIFSCTLLHTVVPVF